MPSFLGALTQATNQRVDARPQNKRPPSNPDCFQIAGADEFVEFRLANIEHRHCAGDPDTNRRGGIRIRVAQRFCLETIVDFHFSTAHDLPAASLESLDHCRERREACRE